MKLGAVWLSLLVVECRANHVEDFCNSQATAGVTPLYLPNSHTCVLKDMNTYANCDISYTACKGREAGTNLTGRYYKPYASGGRDADWAAVKALIGTDIHWVGIAWTSSLWHYCDECGTIGRQSYQQMAEGELDALGIVHGDGGSYNCAYYRSSDGSILRTGCAGGSYKSYPLCEYYPTCPPVDVSSTTALNVTYDDATLSAGSRATLACPLGLPDVVLTCGPVQGGLADWIWPDDKAHDCVKVYDPVRMMGTKVSVAYGVKGVSQKGPLEEDLGQMSAVKCAVTCLRYQHCWGFNLQNPDGSGVGKCLSIGREVTLGAEVAAANSDDLFGNFIFN